VVAMGEGAFETSPPTVTGEDGAEDRFRRIYREHFSDIYGYFLRRADAAEVGDLVSEVFLVVWRRLDDVPVAPGERLWLYGVARRVASAHQRTMRRRTRLSSRIEHEPASRSSEAGSLVESTALELIDRLRPKDREVVKLLVWDRLTREEAAAILGCSANAVGIRWHRSLKHLRRKLGLTDGPEGAIQPGGS
jgi:RNA polymerase sigma factor (sigma-70 family)